MVFSEFSGISVEGMAMAVSDNWCSIENSEYGEDVLKRFKRNTGVSGRYGIVEKQTGADFAYAAAEELIKMNSLEKNEIKFLVYITQFPDYRVPATACVLHDRLGLNDDCMCFDVNQGCSGMVYGIQIIASLLEKIDDGFGLLLLGDTTGEKLRRDQLKQLISEDDNNVLLFGNGGGAVLFRKKTNADKIQTAMCTDGKGYQAIIEPYGYFKHPEGESRVFFNDTAIFDFAVDKPPKLIKDLMNHISAAPSDYDSLVLHQANKMIIKNVTKRAGFDSNQSVLSIDEFANTTCVSILSALVKKYGEEENRQVKSMLCGFGIGLSWGAVSLSFNAGCVLPLIHTDVWFDDGFYD